jgi:hypothetical protein
MKQHIILFLFTILLLLSHICYATTPFADKIVKTKDGNIQIRLAPRFMASLNIEDKNGKLIKRYSITALGLSFGDSNITSAGNDWYCNSIVFLTKTDKYFVARLRCNKTIIIDLKTIKHANNIPQKQKEEIDSMISEKALILLDSKSAGDRKTGAIICGQNKVKKAIPKLKELLADRSSYFQITGTPSVSTIIYFVRKAAKEALEAMGEQVDNTIVEEPAKE